MIQIYPLFRLQQLDSRIASLEHQLGAAEGNAEIEKKIRIRERKLGELDTQRQGLRTKLKDTELRLATVESHIRDIEKKLYSGSTVNSKELAGYSQELELLKKQKGDLEDTVLALMEQVESTAAEAAAVQARLEKARKELGEHHDKVGSSKRETEAQLTQVREKRTEQATEIEEGLLARYDRIRARKEGIGIVRIESGACGECGARITDAVKRRVQERHLELCPYCERILYTD
ncbi:MAG: hypothetical protein EB084_06160 [Proteobacteria bacterium]|nr:hypothetical protein [Pseudomonadota bacterium]